MTRRAVPPSLSRSRTSCPRLPEPATLIGAAAGAAAGTAVVMTTQDADAVLPAGAPMELRLEEALVVKLPAK